MKFFAEPTIEIEKFEMVDVITSSGEPGDWGMGGEDFDPD